MFDLAPTTRNKRAIFQFAYSYSCTTKQLPREKLTDQILNGLLIAHFLNESNSLGFPNGNVKFGTVTDKVEQVFNTLMLIAEMQQQSNDNQ